VAGAKPGEEMTSVFVLARFTGEGRDVHRLNRVAEMEKERR